MSDRISPLLALRRLWASRLGHEPRIEYTGSKEPIQELGFSHLTHYPTNVEEGRLGLWSSDNPMLANSYAVDFQPTVTPLISQIPPEAVMRHDVQGRYFDFPGRSELLDQFMKDDSKLRLTLDNMRDSYDADYGLASKWGGPDWGKLGSMVNEQANAPSPIHLTKPSGFRHLISPFSDPNDPKFRRGGLARMCR